MPIEDSAFLNAVCSLYATNITFTNLHQIYHYIKKESTLLAWKHLTVSHKVSNILSDNPK